jgi:hypothetical protein
MDKGYTHTQCTIYGTMHGGNEDPLTRADETVERRPGVEREPEVRRAGPDELRHRFDGAEQRPRRGRGCRGHRADSVPLDGPTGSHRRSRHGPGRECRAGDLAVESIQDHGREIVPRRDEARITRQLRRLIRNHNWEPVAAVNDIRRTRRLRSMRAWEKVEIGV